MGNQTSRVEKKPLGLSHLAHRKLIGWLGILLPLLVVLFSWMLPVKDVPWIMLDSISAFYYTSATAVFVGILFTLSMFLFTYGGYKGDLADRILGNIAGCAALGVAFFPTRAPLHLVAPPWWLDWMGTAHHISAILLFISFIAFALWIFRRTSVTQKELIPKEKRWRNHLFLVCGAVMIASVVWVAFAMNCDSPIFLPESIALVAFAISWLVKGRAHEQALKVSRRIGRLVKK